MRVHRSGRQGPESAGWGRAYLIIQRKACRSGTTASVDPRAALRRQEHRVERLQIVGNQRRIVFADAGFQRGLVIAKQVVHEPQPRCPILETRDTFIRLACNGRKIPRRNEPTCRRTLGIDLVGQIFPPDSRRNGRSLPLPRILNVDTQISIQIRLVDDRRVVNSYAGWHAVRLDGVQIAVHESLLIGWSPAILYAKLNLVRSRRIETAPLHDKAIKFIKLLLCADVVAQIFDRVLQQHL